LGARQCPAGAFAEAFTAEAFTGMAAVANATCRSAILLATCFEAILFLLTGVNAIATEPETAPASNTTAKRIRSR